jgi:hypothetical protein
MTEIEKDVAALKEFVDGFLELIFEGQVEMKALERVLFERHGVSPEALDACRAIEQAKLDALRQSAGTAIQALKRFQGPPQ